MINNQNYNTDMLRDYHVKQLDNGLAMILKDLPGLAKGKDVSSIMYTIIGMREELADPNFKLKDLDKFYKLLQGLNHDLLPIVESAKANLDKRKKIFKMFSYASYAFLAVCATIALVNNYK